MAKNKSVTEQPGVISPVTEKKKNGKMFLFFLQALLFLTAGGAAVYFYGSNYFPHKETDLSLPTAPVPAPQQSQQITEIKYIIPESITNSINHLHDKVGRIETLSQQYMNIKADSSAVISLGERMDNLEKRTVRLAQISNDGALILTATLMIRENFAAGHSVRFEAEILKQLAASQPEIQKQINYIYNNSSRQYPSDKSLIKEFAEISEQIITTARGQGTWKERLLRKIGEYIHISGSDLLPEVQREINILRKVSDYLNTNQLALAVETIGQPENQELLDNPELNRWYIITDSKLKFNQALSEIASYSLALMKTESLKNNTP